MSKWKIFGSSSGSPDSASSQPASGLASGASSLRVLRRGQAMRVIFFYPGEEGTYVDNAEVTVFENGIVHLKSPMEETMTHLQNCEILWRFKLEAEDRNSINKIRLLKPRSGEGMESEDPSKNPDLL